MVYGRRWHGSHGISQVPVRLLGSAVGSDFYYAMPIILALVGACCNMTMCEKPTSLL